MLVRLLWGLGGFCSLWYGIKIVGMCMGGDGGDAVDNDGMGEGGEIDSSLKLLTTQSLAAFGMGFGWLALALLYRSALPAPTALALGAANGLALMALSAGVMRALSRLTSTPRQKLPQAGDRGWAYTTVVAGRRAPGLVQVVDAASRRARQWRALTDAGVDIAAYSDIEVIDFSADTAIVRPAPAAGDGQEGKQ